MASVRTATSAPFRRMTLRTLERMRRQQHKIDLIKKLDHKPTWHLGVGDRVQLISGRDRKKIGLIKEIQRTKNRVVVEGANLNYRSEPATMARTGYQYKKESSIHVSNVMLVDPETQKPVRFKIGVLEDGSRVRVSVATQNIIERPARTVVLPILHPVTDTAPADVAAVTYQKPNYTKRAAITSTLTPLQPLTTPQQRLPGTRLLAQVQAKAEAEAKAKAALTTDTSSSSSTSTSSPSPSPSWYPPRSWSVATRRRMELFRLKLTGGTPLVPFTPINQSLIAHTIKKAKRHKEQDMIMAARVRRYRRLTRKWATKATAKTAPEHATATATATATANATA